MSDILLHEVKGKSEIITFNNPNKLNVLSDKMLELLLNALATATIKSIGPPPILKVLASTITKSMRPSTIEAASITGFPVQAWP